MTLRTALEQIIEIAYAGHPDGRADRLEIVKRIAECALAKITLEEQIEEESALTVGGLRATRKRESARPEFSLQRTRGREGMNMIRGSDQARSIHRKTVTCANCGSTNVSTSLETDRFAYGAGADAAELSAVVPVHSCAECGTQFTDEEAERLRHETVCRHLGRLTPSEIRDIRIQYGMRRADFAAATRLGEATLARWESGAMLPNAAYDQYLRLLRSRENMARVAGCSNNSK